MSPKMVGEIIKYMGGRLCGVNQLRLDTLEGWNLFITFKLFISLDK